MRIIVAGAGQVGMHLAEMFSKERHDIVVIDINNEKLSVIDSQFDLLTVQGSATSFEILEKAKVKNADLFIAVTQIEEVNILSSILCKNLGVKRTIARVNNTEFFSNKNKSYFNKLGVDTLICPEKLAASEVIGLLKQTGTTEVYDFSGGKLSLFAVKLDKEAPVIGKSLIEISNNKENFDYRAVALYREGQTLIPSGEDKFQINDLVYVITNQKGIDNLLKYAGKKKFEINNLMIVGGSRIGIKTAKGLENQLDIKFIEKNKEKCFKLTEELEKTLVINGDGSDVHLLEDEGLRNMDAFIAVTGNSETNILSCLLAKRYGVKKTIAEIENINYIDIAENIGIDTIINKKLITASYIFGYTLSANVEMVKCLTGTDAEVLEFVVKPNSKITKKVVSKINFPKQAIIGGVVRGKNSFIATGETQILDNDKVVVFSLPDAISKVQKFFK